MNAKERRRARAAEIKAAPLLRVYASALVTDAAGSQTTRPVHLWDRLPPWWNQGTEDQRRLWLMEFFKRQLALEPNQTLVTVTCGLDLKGPL